MGSIRGTIGMQNTENATTNGPEGHKRSNSCTPSLFRPYNESSSLPGSDLTSQSPYQIRARKILSYLLKILTRIHTFLAQNNVLLIPVEISQCLCREPANRVSLKTENVIKIDKVAIKIAQRRNLVQGRHAIQEFHVVL